MKIRKELIVCVDIGKVMQRQLRGIAKVKSLQIVLFCLSLKKVPKKLSNAGENYMKNEVINCHLSSSEHIFTQ